MKHVIIALLAIPTFLASAHGQANSSQYKPFSLLIISPDSISIDESLTTFIDTVESAFQENYYSYLKQLELNEKYQADDEKAQTKLRVERMKWAEIDVLNTKYYQFISMLTCGELWDLLDGENNQDISLAFASRTQLFSSDLATLAKYYDLDYILMYKNITTPIQNGEPVLRIEMQLYGSKQSKIVYQDVAFGHDRFYKDNSGVLRACPNDLECLLESGVITSAFDLYTFLKKRQKK